MEETYVKISDDRSQAWLYLAPKENGKYTKEELIKLLESYGVIAGLNTSNLAAMANKGVYDREICVAKRVEPIEGKDGYYEYAFEREVSHEPKIRPDGTVDYASINVVQSVSEGSVLARYHKAEEGISGKDVCGNMIPASIPKDLPELSGKGIAKSPDDPNVYVSLLSGKIDYNNGQLNINTVYRTEGDVDRVSGNLDYDGDLIVAGNVSAGVSIRCTGSIVVEGTIESASLFAEGDIVLQRGIQGNGKGIVTSGGTIYADFLEQAEINAEGDVQANSIVNCETHSNGRVILTGKKGQILGGTTHAAKGVDCKMIGNDVDTKTIVHVGCEREIYTENTKITKILKKLQAEMEKIAEKQKEIIEALEKNAQSKIPDSQLRMQLQVKLEEIDDKVAEIRKEMKTHSKRQQEIKEIFRETKDSTIRVDGKIYRGTIIGIDQAVYALQKDNSFMEYRNVSGMIAGNVIVSH